MSPDSLGDSVWCAEMVSDLLDGSQCLIQIGKNIFHVFDTH